MMAVIAIVLGRQNADVPDAIDPNGLVETATKTDEWAGAGALTVVPERTGAKIPTKYIENKTYRHLR